MVVQFNPPAPSNAESLSRTVRKIEKARRDEPAVPVYRYFLSGGRNRFRLTIYSAMALVGLSVVGLPFALTTVGIATATTAFGCGISAALVSVPLAALVARWAGRSSAVLAGLLTVVGWTVLPCWVAPGLTLTAAFAIMAILAYGLSELPNGSATCPRAPAAVVFYGGVVVSFALAGLAPLAPIAAVCLGTILGNQDSRGPRFFVLPVGLSVFVTGMVIVILTTAVADSYDPAVWLGPSHDLAPRWPAVVCLAVGVVWTWAQIQTGHGASPLGRFLISWLLAPALLASVGLISAQLAVAITLPAWAAMMGPTLIGLRRRSRAGEAWLMRRCLGHA